MPSNTIYHLWTVLVGLLVLVTLLSTPVLALSPRHHHAAGHNLRYAHRHLHGVSDTTQHTPELPNLSTVYVNKGEFHTEMRDPTITSAASIAAEPSTGDTNEPLHLSLRQPRTGKVITRSTTGPATRDTIGDSSIWFFLATFGIFMTGIIWNVYVRVGIPRLKRMALDEAATNAMHDIELARTSAVRMPEPVASRARVVQRPMPGAFVVDDNVLPKKGVVKRKGKVAGAGSWLKVAFREDERLSRR